VEPFKQKMNVHEGPESKIQAAIISYLKGRDWFVKSTHGNSFQSGFPDLYATHSKYFGRWIEVKNPTSFSFTIAQLRDYPKFCAFGSPIFVMTAATDSEYEKLFRPSNLSEYMACYQDGCRDIIAWRAGLRTSKPKG
jgi:hypothetical protein